MSNKYKYKNKYVQKNINNPYWLYSYSKYHITPSDQGKWMLFVPKNKIEEYWKQLNKIYNNNELTNIVSMKCSTNKKNPNSSNESDGVIILYCNNSNNQEHILQIGKNLLKVLHNNNLKIYNKTSYIY